MKLCYFKVKNVRVKLITRVDTLLLKCKKGENNLWQYIGIEH